ncbi:acyltransferase family protein [Mucilaginibacter sp. UR6-11]|uniref:acyltransferase family protein n=1 Tax=Mucilaginibacter sp. UR6-11 TaxID=1435644 RepID=UPI001E4234B1|nr:acyltransferase family protein [Mucilaginibacter sp. UR6-11]MCC8424857.1 acyltransferase [Mucilaginibacter sp. UR6-11]
MEISIGKSNQLKALAILMMLFLHLFNREYKGLFEPLIFIGSKPLSYYISLFCDACVPIFCFVSGYGLYYKFKKSALNYNNSNVDRIKKLYINYWIILLLFAVLLGVILNKVGYPGSFVKFLLNFTALNNSYNGAWWFFFTYILLVSSSKIIYNFIDNYSIIIVFGFGLFIYILTFYFRVYRPAQFNNDILNWFQDQVCLYGNSLLPFIAGGIALKEKWNTKITQKMMSIKYRSLIAIFCITLLIVIHGIIPNFVIAPFLAIPFVFLFIQIKLPAFINKTLDYLAPHATNLWLIHMFFYITYFKQFIYSPKFVILVFFLLVLCCLLSSIVVNIIYKQVIKRVNL